MIPGISGIDFIYFGEGPNEDEMKTTLRQCLGFGDYQAHNLRAIQRDQALALLSKFFR